MHIKIQFKYCGTPRGNRCSNPVNTPDGICEVCVKRLQRLQAQECLPPAKEVVIEDINYLLRAVNGNPASTQQEIYLASALAKLLTIIDK